MKTIHALDVTVNALRDRESSHQFRPAFPRTEKTGKNRVVNQVIVVWLFGNEVGVVVIGDGIEVREFAMHAVAEKCGFCKERRPSVDARKEKEMFLLEFLKKWQGGDVGINIILIAHTAGADIAEQYRKHNEIGFHRAGDHLVKLRVRLAQYRDGTVREAGFELTVGPVVKEKLKFLHLERS